MQQMLVNYFIFIFLKEWVTDLIIISYHYNYSVFEICCMYLFLIFIKLFQYKFFMNDLF